MTAVATLSTARQRSSIRFSGTVGTAPGGSPASVIPPCSVASMGRPAEFLVKSLGSDAGLGRDPAGVAGGGQGREVALVLVGGGGREVRHRVVEHLGGTQVGGDGDPVTGPGVRAGQGLPAQLAVPVH